MISTTPTVIYSVINKQHWSHKCGCQYIHYNSAPYTHHKLRQWSAFGNTKHTLPPHPLPHLAWRPSALVSPNLRRATQKSVDCESLTPTRGATQQSVDCESLTPTRGATQQSVDSKIVPVSSIAPEGWGPKEGGNATSPLHSRGSPTNETKSEVKTYARGHHDAPSISKCGSLVQPGAQIAALC